MSRWIGLKIKNCVDYAPSNRSQQSYAFKIFYAKSQTELVQIQIVELEFCSRLISIR